MPIIKNGATPFILINSVFEDNLKVILVKNTPPKKTTKQDLLDELESIKASLQGINNSEYEIDEHIDIPILEDLVIDDNACPSSIAQTLEKRSNSDHASAIKKNTKKARSQTKVPDNPFLPRHIRERLKQNRQDSALFYQSLMSNDTMTPLPAQPITSQHMIINKFIAKTISSFIDDISNTTTNTFPLNIEDSTAANIDRLATLYLPIFETQLRQQLTKTIADAKKAAQDPKTP